MGHTNSTANLSLPQFIGTDKPTWLGDVNGAFSAIDAYAGTNDAAVSAAVSDASSAISQAAAAVNTANTANTTAGNASTAANNAIGVANTANAIAGTVDAKVGLLADLNTTDRTSIVNAINEVNAKPTGGHTLLKTVTADGVKTRSQILDELFAEMSDVGDTGYIKWTASSGEYVFNLVNKASAEATFSYIMVISNDYYMDSLTLKASASTWSRMTGSTYSDQSNGVATGQFDIYS